MGGAAGLIEEVAASKISGEEDRYSHTDLWDFANIDGAQKIVDLLRPQLQKNSALLAKVDANFKKVDSILSKYRTKDGFETYDKLTTADRNALKGPITTGGRSGSAARDPGWTKSMAQQKPHDVNEPSRRRLLKGIGALGGALAITGGCPVAHAAKAESSRGRSHRRAPKSSHSMAGIRRAF